MSINLFRRKPTTIEAVEWTGDNLKEIIHFTGLHPSAEKWTWLEYEDQVKSKGLKLFTREGPMMASIGDYIIKDVAGYPYACKPDHFEATYVLVGEEEKTSPAADVERLVEAAEELISAQELVNTEGEKQLKLRSAGPLLQLVRAFAKLKAALAALKGE